MAGVKLVVHNCTTGGASPECVRGSGGQTQRSRLAFFTHAAAEGWGGCQYCSGLRSEVWGGTQVAGIVKDKCLMGEMLVKFVEG